MFSRADSEDEDPHEDWQNQPSPCPSRMIVHGKLQENLYAESARYVYHKYVWLKIIRLFSPLNLTLSSVSDSRAAYVLTKHFLTFVMSSRFPLIRKTASTEEYFKTAYEVVRLILHFKIHVIRYIRIVPLADEKYLLLTLCHGIVPGFQHFSQSILKTTTAIMHAAQNTLYN